MTRKTGICRRPGLTLLLAWHPWAVIRVISFVVIGVVLSAPLLSRLGTFRVDRGAARVLLLAAGAGLIADVVLKTLLAPAWQRLLLRTVGWQTGEGCSPRPVATASAMPVCNWEQQQMT